MKILLIITLILFLILIINLRFKIYKVNREELSIYLIVFKLMPIKIKLTNVNQPLISDLDQNQLQKDKNAAKLFFKHQNLVKKLIGIFSANTCFFSINTKYYLANLPLYLSTFYLYSLMQNLLYTNLAKLKKSCFKSRVKKVDIRLEIDLDLETKVYKVLFFMIKYRKELLKVFKEVQNERSSNLRIVKNIDGKY